MHILRPYLLIQLLCLTGAGPVAAQWFVDNAAELGIEHTYGSPNFSGGASFADFDGDGRDDITMTQFNTVPRCFRNTGSGFELVAVGVQTNLNMKSASWIDYDNDHDRDLFCTSFNGPLKLYRNDGNLQFTDVSLAAGLIHPNALCAASAWGDYDRDGDLDAYICNYDGPQMGSPVVHNWLFRNNGDGTFTECAVAAGVDNGNQYSYVACWNDFNHDIWPDLLVVNDRTNTENFLYVNNGDGTFTDISDASGIGNFFIFAMSATCDDYDNDGDEDFYITNGPQGNLLHRNNGDSTFAEVASETGVSMHGYGWGANFLDADGDGWQDLHVAASPFLGSIGMNAFYRNQGDGMFESYLADAGMLADVGQNFSNPIGDHNQDLKPDILMMGGTPTPTRMWTNITEGMGRLSVELRGTGSNRDGVGSWISCHAGNLHQVRFTHAGESFACQNSFREFFGLSDYNLVDSVVVEWPSGIRDVWYQLPAGQHLVLTEGQGFHPGLQASSDPLLCEGDSLMLSTTAPGEVTWSNGHSGSSIWVHEPGVYSFSVQADNQLVSLSDSLVVAWRDSLMTNVQVHHPLCAGEASGYVELLTAGEEQGVQWTLEPAGNPGDTGALPAGSYVLRASAEGYCSTDTTVVLLDPDTLQVTVWITHPLCHGEPGQALAEVWGGTPPYSMDWLGHNPADLAAGDYVVWVTDAAGCQREMPCSIEQPDLLTLELLTGPATEGGDGGWAHAIVSGGTPPCTFNWMGSSADGPVLSGLSPGAIEVTVTDAQGCQVGATGEIGWITSVQDNFNGPCRLFPNPVGVGLPVFISCRPGISHLRVYDVTGQLCYRTMVTSRDAPVHLPKLSAGTYMVEVDGSGGTECARLLIVP
ncbi:MAG: FG-GAP-like repeat-containing protein [Flavobacteriales bacterium]